TGRMAVEMAGKQAPDVVVMDVAMPDLNGVDATQQILMVHPRIKVIAISARAENKVVAQMLRAGASAFVPKDSAFEELVVAVKAVMANKVFVSSTVAKGLVDVYIRHPEDAADKLDGSVQLSPREREVLQLIAEGLATKEVAFHLGIGTKTVET